MKMKRFMLLASCATLLTGCESDALWGLGGKWNQLVDWGKNLLGLNKEEKKSDDGKKDSAPSTSSITVDGLPESIPLGSVVNLDNYVKLENLTSYEVEVGAASKDMVVVDGHKLMPVVEGTISFSVKSGSLSKSCSFAATSSSRAAIATYFEDVGRKYDVVLEEYNEETQDWEQFEAVIHNDLYVFSNAGQAFIKFSEDDTDAYLCGFTDDGQSFTGVDEESLTLFPVAYLDEFYNPEFSIPFEETVAEYDVENEVEVVVLSDLEATTFAEETMFLPNGSVTLYVLDPETGEHVIDEETGEEETESFPIERIEFVYEEEEYQGETYSLVTAYAYYVQEDELELFAAASYYVGEDYESFEILDEYCVPENKPVSADYWEYFETFNLGQLFPSSESVLGSAGSVFLEYGWVDPSGNPAENPFTNPQSYFYYFSDGSTTKYFSETSIWNIAYEYDQETGQPVSMYPSSGKMEVGDQEKVVYDVYSSEQGFYVEKDSEHSSIWEDSVPTFGGLREHSTWKEGCFSTIYTPEDLGKSYYYFGFVTGKFNEVFYSICGADEEGYLGVVKDAYVAYINVDNLFNYTQGYMIVDLTQGIVVFDFKLNFGTVLYEIYAQFTFDDAYATYTAQYEAAASEFIPAES